jgi:hypothetical protein
MQDSGLERRIVQLRAEARAEAKADAMRRAQPAATEATAEDCVSQGKDPERRLEPLRRSAGAPVQSGNE